MVEAVDEAEVLWEVGSHTKLYVESTEPCNSYATLQKDSRGDYSKKALSGGKEMRDSSRNRGQVLPSIRNISFTQSRRSSGTVQARTCRPSPLNNRTPATPLSVCPEIFDFYPSGAHGFWAFVGAIRTYLYRCIQSFVTPYKQYNKSIVSMIYNNTKQLL